MKFKFWSEAEEWFNEFLDECYGEISVCGYEYPASQVLRRVDPVAYRTSLLDCLNAEGIDIGTLEGRLEV